MKIYLVICKLNLNIFLNECIKDINNIVVLLSLVKPDMITSLYTLYSCSILLDLFIIKLLQTSLDDETVREGRDVQHVKKSRFGRSDFVSHLDQVHIVLKRHKSMLYGTLFQYLLLLRYAISVFNFFFKVMPVQSLSLTC